MTEPTQGQIVPGCSVPATEQKPEVEQAETGKASGSGTSGSKMLHGVHKPAKRGRKPCKIDVRVKLERSRQSARECRARKKLRYQYLEELVASRERAIFTLRTELESYKKHCKNMDEGKMPKEVVDMLKNRAQQKERIEQRREERESGMRQEEDSDDDEDDEEEEEEDEDEEDYDDDDDLGRSPTTSTHSDPN